MKNILYKLEMIFLRGHFLFWAIAMMYLIFFIILWTKWSHAYNNIVNTPNMVAKDVRTNVQYWKYNQLVTAYATQIKEMQARGYSDTRILDLLALKSMECNRYDGLCYWHNNLDLWPFQINKIHKDEWITSANLMRTNQLEGLFKFQLTYANKLVQSYEDRFCGKEHFDYVGVKYTNENRFKCIAKSYNGSPRYKYTYAELGWLKRQIISDLLFDK